MPDSRGQAGFSQRATKVTLVHSNKHPVTPQQCSASPADLDPGKAPKHMLSFKQQHISNHALQVKQVLRSALLNQVI